MDFQSKKHYPNPRKNAGLLSIMFFHWVLPVLRSGSKRPLTSDDLYDHLEEDSAEALGDELENEWRKLHKSKVKVPRLAKALVKIHWKPNLIPALVKVFDQIALSVLQAILLKLFTKSFSDPSVTRMKQYIYGLSLCLVTFLRIFTLHLCNFRLLHINMKCRVGLSSLIYRKVLRLTMAGQRKSTIGQLSNFLSSDVNSFRLVVLNFTVIISVPIQILSFTFILWQELGVSCLAGIGFTCFLSTLQYFNGKYSVQIRQKLSARTDARANMMNEIISAMRVIKMYAWEIPFSAVVSKLRRLETKALKKRYYVYASFGALYHLSYSFCLLLVLLPFVLCGNTLTADKAFFAVMVIREMIDQMVLTLPVAIAGIAEFHVGMKRIETFLDLIEHKSETILKLDCTNKNPDGSTRIPSIEMKNLNGSWELDKMTLENINLNYQGSQLVMVVGEVGSGKSSLLSAILGELPIRAGHCTVKGRTSYAAQEPWIFSGNIRQNIVFGQSFNQSRYEEVIRCCCLGEDLKQWPDGDLTIVGERGVLLSGGQKARVGLARSVYRPADVYLMDDPLSAVDQNVSREIIEKCILGFVCRSLKILVTHQIQYLPYADHIIVLENGAILAEGKYSELLEQNVHFQCLVNQGSPGGSHGRKPIEDTTENVAADAICESTPKADSEKDETEKMLEGSVTWKTYWKYVRSGDSLCKLFLILAGFLLVNALISTSSYWLSYWTNQGKLKPEAADDNLRIYNSDVDNVPDSSDQLMYLSVYAGLVITLSAGIFTLVICFFQYSLTVGVNMHNRMFASIIRAPILFFDRQSSGRIINRFTKDLNSMDEHLPMVMYDAVDIFLKSMFLMAIVVYTNQYMVFPTSIVFMIMYGLRSYYIQTARSIKRIESTTRSPLFTFLNATFQGITTIRAFGSQNALIKQFDAYQDINTSAHYLFLSTTRWFAVWLEFTCLAYFVFSVLGFLFLSTSSLGGDVGLALSSIMILLGTFQWGLRQSAETESIMTSVERILEYSSIQPEALLVSRPELTPPKNWPADGNIRFNSISLSYNGTRVLDNLTFEVKSMEKLGIVGRTGAGKSSIVAALFRMTEVEGQIFVDDVLTQNIGLHDLRKAISIIPQDPVLFSGTVRYNLDPFGQYEDSELWQALEEVEMKDAIPALDFVVADRGNNFSVGQKQLVCLARAILRKNKIIVMDEATANVDMRTDNLIQKTIRSTFLDCTILTIAHRLDTVMDCDRILVLEKGNIVEYGSPVDLRNYQDGHLFRMLEQNGHLNERIVV